MKIREWLDEILVEELPEEVVAICFNLYEESDDEWAIEMIGTGSFDEDDPDWACDEEFDTRDDLQIWKQEGQWEEIQQYIVKQVTEYLQDGKYAEKLKFYEGIGVGFVDGDISIVYRK